ncbi:GGDEF domain-containing protein [Allorhizobium pseudoryzae]|uniref:GGDEF domain-containing protein n=1 Tax=Allorhizobium pseudoryzae TaxID=379684 RepID=UPI003CFDE8A2
MDYATAMMLWATEALTLAILMVGAWLHDRRQAVTGLWGLGFGLHGIGVALVGLRGVVPDAVSVIGGNGLMLIGIAAWCNGVLLYDGHRMRFFPLAPLVAWLAALLVPFIMENFWTRSVAIQLAAGASYLTLAMVLLYGRQEQRLTRLAFALVSTVQACLMFKMAFDCFHLRPSSFVEMPHLTSFAIGNIFCLVAGILLGAQLLMARSEAHLQHLADSDPLTGVLNRRGLLDRFHQLCRKAVGGKNQIAIVIFDLDHFKQVNDRHGHKAGDTVLLEFCRVATTCLGQRGIFGRMGGEEFACMMQVGGAAEAIGITEAIRLTLEHSDIVVDEAGTTVSVTVSCGIGLSPIASADLDQMLICADRALYAAKFDGRNGTAIASSLKDDIQLIGPGAIDPTHEEREPVLLKRPALVPITGGRI